MATQRFYDGQPGPDIRRELNNFEAILDGTVAAAQAASTAATSASVKAQQWADAAPGVEVETGKYSAKHWADRAQTTVTGGLIYRGSHSAASGAYPATPSLGDYYKISVAGTLGGVEYSVGDSLIYNGTDWDKIDSTDAVTSVAGRVGEVVLTKDDVGLGNVDNTSDANKPISSATQTALNGKEPVIAAPVSAPTEKYWRGDKTWRDFFTDVRAATLTGLSTATNAVVVAADTVLAAIGKLQSQVSAKFDKTGGDVDGNINFTGTGRRITGDFSNGTVANRTLFQTGVANDATDLTIVPNGTATYAAVSARSSYSENASVAALVVDVAAVTLASYKTGSGAYLPLTFFVGNADRMRIDPTTGNVLATSGALGYGAGAGGTVVQDTSKTTPVALNKPTGQITMHNAALAAGALATFQLNNNLITPVDALILTTDAFSIIGYPTEKYSVSCSVLASGAHITVKNISAGSLSEALRINFTIIKGATS
jgi:hypothetical protein